MSLISLLFLVALSLNAQARIPGPGGKTTGGGGPTCTPTSGYAHCRQITINHGQVVSTLTNFPVTQPGGISLGTSRIQNASCFDVIYTSDSAGTTKIPWEHESCNSATGVVIPHFLVASVSASVDTNVYVSYDNAAITTAQNTGGNAPTVIWAAYKRTYHLADNAASTTVIDSSGTANGTASANTSTLQMTGEIDGGFNFNGNPDGFSIAPITFTGATAAWTISLWFKTTNASYVQLIGFRSSTSGSPILESSLGQAGAGIPRFQLRDDSGSGLITVDGTVALNDGNWHYLTLTRNSSQQDVLYIDGTSTLTGTDTMGAGMTFDADANFGRDVVNSTYSITQIDEPRVMFSTETAAQVTTEYNNQKPSSTFLTIGAEQ